MFSKFLSLHNCIGHVFILSWKEQFFPYFYSLFYIVDLLYSTHILLLATSSVRKRVCRNQTNEMEQKKKKKKTKRRKSCNYGGLAHYTHQANQLYVIGIPIEFFQRCTGTREEPDSSWIVSKTINTCSSTCVSVYVCVCVCVLCFFICLWREYDLILIISNIIIV